MPERSRRPVESLVSSGGVVYRMAGERMQVVLCGRHEPPLWGLPKGTPDIGETLQETALREVREETGLDVEIQSPLGTISYEFTRHGIPFSKTVHYHLMVPLGGSTDRHDPEFDIVQWFDVDEACQRLTYDNDVEMVRRAVGQVMGNGAAAIQDTASSHR